jgi:putative ABC transport system permease protein
MLNAWWQDLRFAGRGLRRAPAFVIAAVLTLAVGMAGALSMFALIQGVLLRPLPVPDEARLFVGWRALPEAGARRWPFRTTDIDLLRRESRLLESVAGVGYQDPGPMPIVERGTPTFVRTARVTGDFFRVLGVPPILGRTLTPADDVAGAENVLVLTHGLWQRRYGGSLDVLGRRVLVNEQPFTIVGVMPADVDHPRHVEAWMSVTAMQATTSNATFREAMASELDLIARVRPGVTATQAGTELRALAPQLDAQRDAGNQRGLVPTFYPYREFLIGDVRAPMLVLFGAVGLVLVIASTNVANLLLLRGEWRRTEFAVRAALGAGRGRLIRQVLTESAVLASLAGGTALVATTWLLPFLVRWTPDELPRLDAVRIDAGVASFCVVLALVVAFVAGVGPAFAATRLESAWRLRDVNRGATRRPGRGFVVAQVALAVTVMVAAAALTRTVLRLQDVGVRLASDRLVYIPLVLPQTKYAESAGRRQFLADLAAHLEGTSSIAAATPINATPFTGLGWDAPTFTAEGQETDRAKTNPTLNLEEIYPNYFDTFEVALVRGRAFTEFDRDGTTPVAIVSDDVAALTWPGQDPINKRLKMGGPDSPSPWWTVVGVAAPTRYREIREPRATLYVPAAQFLGTAQNLVVRTSAPLSLVADLVQDHVRALDPDVQIMPPQPFPQLLNVPLGRPRFYAFVIALFSATAMALAALGLYSVLAAIVRQQRREIGVRLAMGATARDVRRLVLGEGCRLMAVGAMLGLALAAATSRLLRGLLFEVQPLDPGSLVTTGVFLLALGGLALFLPVREATRVDPASMFRAE